MTWYEARTGLALTPHTHLPAATVYSLSLTLIAAIYVGFAVADGRRSVIAAVFFVVAAVAVTASPWLLVAGLAGHGAKDL